MIQRRQGEQGSAKKDPRFPFGLSSIDHANYLWIHIFYSALNEPGRAGVRPDRPSPLAAS